MISEDTKAKILSIWDAYVSNDNIVRDTKGRVIDDIDSLRVRAIEDIKGMILQFRTGYIDLREFKTVLDGYNKRNNLWGFTATKGQMFFNQLVKSAENDLRELAALVSTTIAEPKSLEDALDRITEFENYVKTVSSKAADKRKVPNPGSVGYFLSYFWQIHDHNKWPLMYTSRTKAFSELGLYESVGSQSDAYRSFYLVNDEIKDVLKRHAGKEIGNWDAEHAFWNYNGDTILAAGSTPLTIPQIVESQYAVDTNKVEIRTKFAVGDYLIPKVARLVELCNETEKSKANEYEKLVGEIFRQLDFQVDVLGQGSGRNPDVVAKYREENTAFLIDAKAYSNGYSMGTDDRAIREYISSHCPKLQKDGFKKIGFIIVSNSFKTISDEFVNDITWTTDIKRFIFLTSEALLYLLAYKTKDKLNLSQIIESMITLGGVINAEDVIKKFDDF